MSDTLFPSLTGNWRLTLLFIALSGLTPGAAAAENWDIGGSVGAELRAFPHSPRYADQRSGAQGTLLLKPELRYRSPDRRHLVRIAPNIRLDSRDAERHLADLTELVWTWADGDREIVAGINKVFWGVAESRHLVDIVNQTDLADDLDGEEKLGQPMISFATQRDWGRISAFALPGFRERNFAGRNGRLRAPLPVDTDHPEYQSGARERHVDLALRYTHYFGDWDIGAAVFRGTGREPRLRINDTGTALIPVYEQITQFGADLQYTREAWLWKFEGIVRSGQGDTFAATVAGFEYTLYQLGDTAADLGLLFEYLYDGRDRDAPVTIYDNDVFAGARLALNDMQDTSLLTGAVIDMGDGSALFSVEAERRLGDRWKVELESRWPVNTADRNPLHGVTDDAYLSFRLSRYF
ncbi:MAG: hypothetical protein ACE5G3_01405 [Gammaproteobacteria bacterium]